MTQALPALPERDTIATLADEDAGTYTPTSELVHALRALLDEMTWVEAQRVLGLPPTTINRVLHGRPMRWATLSVVRGGLLHHFGPRKLARLMGMH